MSRFLDRWESFLQRIDRSVATGRRWPIILFCIALALKAVYVVQSSGSLNIRVPIADSHYYDVMARDIASGHILRHDAFFMGPLYPYVLALIYAIFGRHFMLVRLLQAAGGAATVVLLFLIGRRVFRPSVALLGAVLLMFYGAITFYETQLLMEWLGTLLNCLALYLLVSGGESISPRRCAAAGAVVGLSALARASILIFAAVAAVWLLRATPRPRARTRALAFAGAVVVLLLPATVHNYIVSRVFIPVTSNAGLNFYIGNSARANGTFFPVHDVDLISDVTTLAYVERITGRVMSPTQVSRFWFDRALADIGKDPGRELKLMGIKTALFFNGFEVPQIESFDVEKTQHGWLRVLFVRLWPIMVLAIFGMALGAVKRRGHPLLYAYVLAYAASIILFFVTGRYRSQVAPILCLFAASGLVALPGRFHDLRSGSAMVFSLAALTLVTGPALFRIDTHLIQFREEIRRGRRLALLHSFPPAVRAATSAIKMYPKDPEGYVQRAIIYKQSGNDLKAIEDYNRALDIDPDQPSVHYDLAQTFRQVNLREQAVKEYQLATKYDPRMAKAYNNMGITLRELKHYDEAVQAFRKVIDVSPGYERAYNNLGASYAEMGRLDEAIATFKETTHLFPNYPTAYKNLAMAYAAKREPRLARDAMRLYTELAPQDAQARELLKKLEIAARADSSSTGGQ